MFRKSPADTLQQTYTDCCNLSIKNLTAEEDGNFEIALKGWKSLHTSLLYKISLFEKTLHKLSNDELVILSDLKSIRDENVRHLVRCSMVVDESNRRRKEVWKPTPAPPPPTSRNNSSMSVPSLRNGARPRPQPNRAMMKSLRPAKPPVNPASAATAATAANSSWNTSKLTPVNSRTQKSSENLFDDFDQGSRGERKSPRHTSITSETLLIDLSDDEDILYDYFSEASPVIGSFGFDNPAAPVPGWNSMPQIPQILTPYQTPQPSQPSQPSQATQSSSQPQPYHSPLIPPTPQGLNIPGINGTNGTPTYQNSSTPNLVPSTPAAKKKYTYNKPKPIDVNAIMRKTQENSKRSNITYNYVKPTKKTNPTGAKPVRRAAERAPSPAPEQAPEPVEVVPVDPHDAIISSIKGVDVTMAKQILNDIVVNGDEVYWEDIVGLESAKNSLKEAVVYPFLRPDLFRGLREPTRGMLLFGPPGTGKTMLARAVATESKSTFFSVSASSLTSKYLGESEKLVKTLFQLARKLAPSIVFIDEIDSMLNSRSEGEAESSRRIKNEFLVLWSELSSAAAGRDSGDDVTRVLILGATNLPWSIDEAARRRFVRRQYIPLPEGETRKNQIEKLLKYQNHTLLDTDFCDLIELTDGFSGSDLTALAKDSAMGPLRELGDDLLSTPTEDIRAINLGDFSNSLGYIRPSVLGEGLKRYEEWAARYGSSGA